MSERSCAFKAVGDAASSVFRSAYGHSLFCRCRPIDERAMASFGELFGKFSRIFFLPSSFPHFSFMFFFFFVKKRSGLYRRINNRRSKEEISRDRKWFFNPYIYYTPEVSLVERRRLYRSFSRKSKLIAIIQLI